MRDLRIAGSLGAGLAGLAGRGQGTALVICGAIVLAPRAGRVAPGWRLSV